MENNNHNWAILHSHILRKRTCTCRLGIGTHKLELGKLWFVPPLRGVVCGWTKSKRKVIKTGPENGASFVIHFVWGHLGLLKDVSWVRMCWYGKVSTRKLVSYSYNPRIRGGRKCSTYCQILGSIHVWKSSIWAILLNRLLAVKRRAFRMERINVRL